MSRLNPIIRAEILEHGPIRFARFMDLALYHPEFGYYRRAVDPFGTNGDFFTASQLQPVFGEAVASFASQLDSSCHGYDGLNILELGPGRQELRGALNRWNYQAIDWNSPTLPDSFHGLVIANEFFDALPVHLLRKRKSGWLEVAVSIEHEEFVVEDAEVESDALLDYAEQFGAVIPIDGLLEVNLELSNWIGRLAQMLTSGLVLVIDYGYSANELARFPDGTLAAYSKHHAENDPLLEAGSRDLTAHVNFTYLRECAIEKGFAVVEESSLASWLMQRWSQVEFEEKWREAPDRWRLQWKQLVFGMGETFRVMVLRKLP